MGVPSIFHRPSTLRYRNMEKRKFESNTTDSKALVVKRPKTDEIKGRELIAAGVPRTSSLIAPIVVLEGHQAEVYTCKFDPSGKSLASAGFDKRIFLWQVQEECANYHVFDGHKNAVQEIHWSTDGERLFSASADKTVMAWDTVVGVRVKKLNEHTSFVNSLSVEEGQPARERLGRQGRQALGPA